jgi:adenylate cyclase
VIGKRRAGTRVALFFGVCALATAISLGAYAGHTLRSLELRTVDLRFSIRGSTGAPKDVAVVAVDDRTFGGFQNRLQWPFPRRYHAKVIDRIAAGHPNAIAVDIQFTEPTDPRDDNALIESVAHAGHVVLATTEVDAHGHTNIFGGDSVLHQIGAFAANASLVADPDGVLRHVRYAVDGLTTFSVAAATVSRGRPVPPPRSGSEWIDYAGPPGTVKTYSYYDVYSGKVPPSAFRGKVVVIGASAPSLQDVHATSASGSAWMPGAEIQANAIQTALRGFPLQSTPAWLNVLLIALLGLLPALAIRLRAFSTPVIAIAAGGLFALAVQLSFDHGRVVLFTYPLLALVLGSIGSLVVWYVLEAFERARTRDLFGRFVPATVVDQVLARTDGHLRLGGEKVYGTAMFTDLRGFTTFSEGRPADEVIGLLNMYLSTMSDAVLAHGGTLVTYTGDGMMAVFGAPLPQADHADRALAAGREMLEVRLPEFNEWLREQGHDYSFLMGVGLCSGDFMSGNVGSERRLEYTAIGDTINTASRIEGLTKDTPYALFMAGSTREALTNPPEDLLLIDRMAIRGRANAIEIWSLASERILKPEEAGAVAPAKPPADAAPAPAAI